MSDHNLTEEPLQFGENGRLFGILTQPSVPSASTKDLPVFVFVNSGLLHRVGPRRLYVRLARALAEIGFTSLRVDLAGKGDSLPSYQLTTEQSLAEDYKDIVAVLEARLDHLRLVVGGLCSGADDAIKLAPSDSRVIGMVLLDAICDQDEGFRMRDVARKYTHLARYRQWLKKRINALRNPTDDTEQEIDYLTLRDIPTMQQLQVAFESIHERQGRVFSLFTSYSVRYYNQEGQLGRVLKIAGYQQFGTELFWPEASHTYSLELHRSRLIEEVKTWAAGYKNS